MKEPYNISLYPGSGTTDGRRGDHVLLAPAYNVSAEDIHTIVDRAAAVITKFFGLYAHTHKGWLSVGSGS